MTEDQDPGSAINRLRSGYAWLAQQLASFLKAGDTPDADYELMADEYNRLGERDLPDWNIPTTLFDRPERAPTSEPWTPKGYRLLTAEEIQFERDCPLPVPVPPRTVVWYQGCWEQKGYIPNWDTENAYYAVPEDTPPLNPS